ncbi:fasciclin domain-containing protein [Psychromonas sp. 14N.309.X.WAT.B.A12]|uniref:fasciclin domain-containing protein n=1 Tax=Psychromonas sp. 14N.309.X.WAT.B.A12 TaxID=2998322 RepID=UPI0025AF6F8F|nr:fasciclin domain-containing protein [Psychromonas sp. 14N.309.X.WAT.B.A12]MDN2662598.1 fasciclin domain-containing protein [Psychromonas sp. 14N.309.X.WAT.B.A12]
MLKKFITTLSILVASFTFTSVAQAAHHGTHKDIVEVASENGSFTTLVAAVKAAGLVDTLKGEGPFTVFAPTDDAFSKLPEDTVEMLLKPENKDKLVAVLTYHVVPGKVTASEVVKIDSAKTVQGQSVMIKVNDDKVMVNNAHVVIADVEASNGIIHAVDTVLMPK